MFQSTSPQGERHFDTSTGTSENIVSIHVPTRGTTMREFIVSLIPVFQSTSPQGERRCARQPYPPILCFNPRPHKGNDCSFRVAFSKPVCFNPRPHKGNDRAGWDNPVLQRCFNPRPHKGNDLLKVHCQNSFLVSIHVPTRGTTYTFLRIVSTTQFQSTSPQGERLRTDHLCYDKAEFQSTSPQGERQQNRQFFLQIFSHFHLNI